LALSCLGGGPSAAGEPPPGAVPLKRHVLGLFDGAGEHAYLADAIHEVLEAPLNYLGVVVDRHDIRAGAPAPELLLRARAVLTFFHDEGAAPEWLWPWLENDVAAAGARVIHFGDWGPLVRPKNAFDEDPARLGRWLARFGLDFDDGFRRGPIGIDVAFRDLRLCAFESDPRVRAVHRGPRNRSRHNQVWVATRDAFEPGAEPRAQVVTGPWGGIALDPWTLSKGAENDERRWHLDPYAFFREALGLERAPVPQPAVLNGRRMFFMQVDGDGFESLSAVDPGQPCAKVFRDDVLARYALPFTVSVIVRGLTDDLLVAEPTPAMRLAREIFRMEHVEPASHGVLHPLRWRQKLRPDSPPRSVAWYPSLANYEYGPVAEVRESMRFIEERLLDAGRRCRIFLWTGDADPPEEALLEAERDGRLHMNGGLFRWDAWSDSAGFVSPWGRRIGRGLQVYAGAANENNFDGFFTTMPGAFRHIDTTIERTGSPRILKPADLYVHFYIAEKPARLASLHALVRRWAFVEETAPVFASTYVEAVRSAVGGCAVYETAEGWALRDFGACRTARIDGETREVDFARSRGLLGARRIHGALHLHLAAPDADVVLAAAPAPLPHIEQANHLLEEAALDPGGVRVRSKAFSRREIVFAGFPPGARIEVRLDGVAAEGRADARGRVAVVLPEPGSTLVEVRLR